jgi:hypothetical protein
MDLSDRDRCSMPTQIVEKAMRPFQMGTAAWSKAGQLDW